MWFRTVLGTFIGLSLGSVSVEAGVRVVSDIDDTTKITNVADPFSRAWNGLFSSRAFSGMSELYSTLAVERGYSYEYLTGAPEFFTEKVRYFLGKNGFPKGGLHLRPLVGSGSLREYKTRVLKKILETYPDDKFIFIGDDTQRDFEVYDDVYRSAPDRILSIYIRKITNRPLPPSAYPFLSAFDIARTEYIMGRLEVSEVAPTAIAIISEPHDRRIMPRFTYCPVLLNAFYVDPKIEKWTDVIGARVEKICRSRRRYQDEK